MHNHFEPSRRKIEQSREFLFSSYQCAHISFIFCRKILNSTLYARRERIPNEKWSFLVVYSPWSQENSSLMCVTFMTIRKSFFISTIPRFIHRIASFHWHLLRISRTTLFEFFCQYFHFRCIDSKSSIIQRISIIG